MRDDTSTELQLLYPSSPFDKKRPDTIFAEEYDVAQSMGYVCSLYSAENLEYGQFRPRPMMFIPNIPLIYRGWMMTLKVYQTLYDAVETAGTHLLTSPTQYHLCHHLPEWYESCREFTPKTKFYPEGSDFYTIIDQLGWSQYFVKDYVKSLTTERGSVANSADEINEIIIAIKQYRGNIEGGVCLRQFEALQADSEERYFVFNGKAYGRTNTIPDIVHAIIPKINSPFYSVDIVLNTDGVFRLIELGDGQVSNRKAWTAEQFMRIFTDGIPK